MATYTLLGADPQNLLTHVVIEVCGKRFSVFKGAEQYVADEYFANKTAYDAAAAEAIAAGVADHQQALQA